MSTRLAVDLSLNIPLNICTTSTALGIPSSDSTHRLVGGVSYTNLKAEWCHDCLHHHARVLPSCREGSDSERVSALLGRSPVSRHSSTWKI
ncbi:hypothetical protein FOMPIDRAFT_1022623 [Fomitopsis schrenkii]|uniref:Uncharacterized protein n=1 Tax=Fomitopsis schrenkii TaxID=2126942 RepID=S8FP30_FOMSC|nr:hypothetical protein FOMPIDRAFT_1022623 [Fomitopsis schrenkii]